MKKSKLFIFLICISILTNIVHFEQNTVFASEKNFYEVLSSIVEQYQMSHTGTPKDTDELIEYADHLARGDAIMIWDDVYDGDGIMGNTFSKDRIFADGNDILFQTKEDAVNKTDNFIHYIMDENTLECITDKTTIFDLLDQMDKSKSDDILQDGFGHTISRDIFINTPGAKILLKNDKFTIIGVNAAKGGKIRVEKVEIDKSSISIIEGEQCQLTATVLPFDATEQGVYWSSDKSSIASVDKNGKVTAKKAGTAKITVTTIDGKKTAVCQVSVKKDKNSYVVGQTPTLGCAANYGTIEWVSSDTSVVRILSANGQYCTIKCLKPGKATIIAYVHSFELVYDPMYKVFERLPKMEDYAHYNITVTPK